MRRTRSTTVLLYACHARLTFFTKARALPWSARGLHTYYQLMAILCIFVFLHLRKHILRMVCKSEGCQ